MRDELAKIPSLRDLQFGQTLDYPAIQVNVNRQMAGQLGVTVDQVGRSFAAATSSSRFVAPNYWADPRTGIAFQVQVQVPQPRMTTLEDLRVVPVTARRRREPLLGDLARIENATIVGEYDRVNGQRMVTLTANVAGEDLGRATDSRERGDRAGGCSRRAERRSGARADRGDGRDLHEHHRRSARRGRRDLPAARRQFPVAAARVRRGLHRSGGAGRRGADAAGHGNDAERAVVHGRHHGHWRRRGKRDPAGDLRRAGAARDGGSPLDTAIDAARARMRPVLMTSAAMIAGMIPMALALGEGADATAPLGRAVIGGLAAATLATLIVLPSVYSLVQQSARATSPSLDPDDPDSAYGAQQG